MAESSGGAGRVLFRLFALVVVAAAGVGGWFAYDWLLGDAEADAETSPRASASSADDQTTDDGLDDGLLGDDPLADDAAAARDVTAPAGGSSPPWPADLVPATEPWGSFVTTYRSMDGSHQQMAFDGLTKQTQMKVFDAAGVQVGIVEVRGTETWADEGEGWQLVDVPNGGSLAGVAHDHVTPQSLHRLLPPATWPYVTLVSDVADPEQPGVRRLGFEFDVAAFAAADPMVAAEWREDLLPPIANARETWFIDVDAGGHIVRLEFESGHVLISHAELVQPILFTSPLAG